MFVKHTHAAKNAPSFPSHTRPASSTVNANANIPKTDGSLTDHSSILPVNLIAHAVAQLISGGLRLYIFPAERGTTQSPVCSIVRPGNTRLASSPCNSRVPSAGK
jgi:hypothetical protein